VGASRKVSCGSSDTDVSQVWPSRRPTIVDGTTRRAGSDESGEKGNEPKQTRPVPGRK